MTTRTPRTTPYTQLLDFEPGAGDIEQRVSLLRQMRANESDDPGAADRAFFREIERLRAALLGSRKSLEELGGIVEQLSASPWHPARYIDTVAQDDWQRALVLAGNSLRLVDFAPGVEPESLATGAEVFLSHDQNVVMSISTGEIFPGGETAHFERLTSDGRIVLRQRDEEIVVRVASSLDTSALEVGDPLRWDRGALMAVERLEDAGAQRYAIDEPLDLDLADIGGLGSAFEMLLDTLSVGLLEPDLAASYQLSGQSSVLLTGPPGCGKTLVTRVAASMLRKMTDRPCRFFVIKPGELESPWVGQTQFNIRAAFEGIRRDAGDGIAVVFIDEVESIARHRGAGLAHHDDQFTAAWLAELDGFESRGNIVIVSASNRKDLIDAAMLERLSGVEIAIPRPDLSAARRIFAIHLNEAVPVHPNGSAAAATREELIEVGVSGLFAPNACPEFVTLHFRDSSTRSIGVHELVSGRLIKQICHAACTRALARRIRGGGDGVRVDDVRRAVADATERLRTTLTAANASRHIADLPDDVDVVRVERPRNGTATRELEYLNVD